MSNVGRNKKLRMRLEMLEEETTQTNNKSNNSSATSSGKSSSPPPRTTRAPRSNSKLSIGRRGSAEGSPEDLAIINSIPDKGDISPKEKDKQRKHKKREARTTVPRPLKVKIPNEENIKFPSTNRQRSPAVSDTLQHTSPNTEIIPLKSLSPSTRTLKKPPPAVTLNTLDNNYLKSKRKKKNSRKSLKSYSSSPNFVPCSFGLITDLAFDSDDSEETYERSVSGLASILEDEDEREF
eukprot:UN33315